MSMGSRVVVVTGASSGIGRAAALAFAERRDRLVLAARGPADLDAVAARCGGDPLTVPTDVTSAEDVEKLAAAAVDRFGRIDVWVDTAAVMAYGKFEDIPADVFERVVVTDLLGPANVARAALRQFRTQGAGTLILCSSLLAHITVPYMSAYATAKWGMRALARSLRQETRDAPDIHICTLAPGSVDTPIYTSAANYAGFIARPPPPVDQPERMADAVVRLADRPRHAMSIGAANRLIQFGFGVLPPVYDALVGPLIRIGGLSRSTKAPTAGNVFVSQHRVEGGPGRWSRSAVGAAVAGAAATVTGAAALALRRSRR
jgi:NAD(P)-dependent dehydrogenase (short-subunit alcohol dehydrogenase family)